MIKAVNGGGNNNIGVFADLTVKAGVLCGGLGLLKKLGIVATVKKLGGDGYGFEHIASGQMIADYVGFCLHKEQHSQKTAHVQRAQT